MSFFERLKTDASAEWRAYTEHPFTNGLADGSLAEAAFRHYLVQDYLFLIEFARAYALSVYKSPKLADMREAAAGLSAILDIEMNLHVKLCAGWGLSPSDLEQTPPAVEMLAYTRYVLDAGMRGDLLALQVALAPCVIGYAEIATRLASRPDAHAATNPYRVWIAEYAGAPYQEVAAKARARLEGLADLYVTPAREAELIVIFKEATRLEADFWEMGWRAGQCVEWSLAASRVGRLAKRGCPAHSATWADPRNIRKFKESHVETGFDWECELGETNPDSSRKARQWRALSRRMGLRRRDALAKRKAAIACRSTRLTFSVTSAARGTNGGPVAIDLGLIDKQNRKSHV